MCAPNILLLTASIGSGHTRAAEAIVAALREHMPEANISIVDFMQRDVSVIHYLMKRIYLIMLSLVPNIYDVCFRVAGASQIGGIVRKSFALVMTRAMKKIIEKYQPDMIVATHPFPEGAAARWRSKYKLDYALVALMTDYTIHEIWLTREIDAYFVATENMKRNMERQGFEAERVFVTGIPILPSNLTHSDKALIKNKLGIKPQSKVILLMGGGLGLGGIQRALASLEDLADPLTLLIVAGDNNELQQMALRKSHHSNHYIKVWGYTDQIPELMRVADILITKPGALTLAEAFAMGVPLLLHDPIPGPETENARFATRSGAAVWLHKGEKIAPAVEELLTEDKLSDMSAAALAIATPLASKAIANHIVKLIQNKNSNTYKQ